ncbi:MAG: RagB/SusD family nutrient uptake outer membrane protein [Bacteroidetes bacterium]|nr:RagB/SusD family nutrient uptake outer membrane protein [Bacteroidota bacterium]
MKTNFLAHKKIFLPVLLVLVFANGCKKEFLDRKPLGQLTFDTFFQNEEQAIQATNAVYNQYRSFDCAALALLACSDIISDDADKGSVPNDQPPIQEIDDFVAGPSNSFFSAIWRGHYRAIARANLAIQNIPNVDMDASLRDRLVGECRFLRAHSYMLLVQWFGALPLITEPLNEDEYYAQQRQPVESVYAQIEADLLAAITALPEKNGYASKDLGRATKGAAKGLLAKLYMLKKDYANAERYCMEIIQSNQYSLVPNYANIFTQAYENGQESLFEIQAAAYPAAVAGPGASPYNMVQGVRGTPNLGWGFNRPSDNLVAAYENTLDPRRKATIINEGDVLPDGTVVQDNPQILYARYNKKAWVPSHSGLQDNGPGNIRILRYADILLLAAEALNENNKQAEALTYLNQVRKRARDSSPVPLPGLLPNVTITDQAQLRERIYRERRVELAMEQLRWFDLLRWGRAASVMQAVGKTNFVAGKNELLPIPQTEIDLTGQLIAQNPNY